MPSKSGKSGSSAAATARRSDGRHGSRHRAPWHPGSYPASRDSIERGPQILDEPRVLRIQDSIVRSHHHVIPTHGAELPESRSDSPLHPVARNGTPPAPNRQSEPRWLARQGVHHGHGHETVPRGALPFLEHAL